MSYNGIKPRNKSEAKIWNYFNKWDWFPIRTWPRALAKAMITKNLTNKNRFAVFLFFVGNGLSPEQAHTAILQTGRYFDSDAIRHLKYLERNIEHMLLKYKVWDMTTNNYTTPETARLSHRNWRQW